MQCSLIDRITSYNVCYTKLLRFALLEEYMPKNNGIGEFIKVQTIDERIKGFISDNFNIEAASLEKLYHPSALDIYKAPYNGKDGKYS